MRDGSIYNYITMTEVFPLFSEYRILKQIGAGGRAILYQAVSTISNEIVALKVSRSDVANPAEARAALHREAALQATIDNPRVIAIKDVLDFSDSVVIVQEYVEGTTLWHWLERGSLEVELKWWIATNLCEAIAAIHQAGIVHGDLKPLNVLVGRDGNPFLKITDFGEAHRIEDPAQSLAEVWGSPLYMSPEQCRGEASTTRSDVYSLGMILYRLWAESLPYPMTTYEEAVHAHLHLMPDVPQNTPTELAAVILRALDKTPAQRQQTATELLHELKACYNIYEGTD